MSFHIRPYHPSDLINLYRICLLTGHHGEDATPFYRDPDLLGHYYAAPYAVLEPDLCFMLTKNGRSCGYVLGTRDTGQFGRRCETDWFPPLRQQYPLPEPEDKTADSYLIRALHKGHDRENDPADYPAHLHIDILPEGQGGGWGRKLMETFLARLREVGVTAVHLGVSRQNPRAIGFYHHIGFHQIAEYPTSYVLGMNL